MKRLLILALAACLVSCAHQPKNTLESSDMQPVKSESDTRDYRYLQLDNRLRVLLISDPDTETAAASLDVAVGSGSDPADRAGLAHFLEHML